MYGVITSLGNAKSMIHRRYTSRHTCRPLQISPIRRVRVFHGILNSWHPRASSPAAETAEDIAVDEDETLIVKSPEQLPMHWLDYMNKLRPGERRALKEFVPVVAKINALEPQMQSLSDADLIDYTRRFKSQLASGESTLESILPEAFAVVREASFRVLGMRHFDVQLLGGIILAQGRVAEMKTGEGKTLVATLPAYLNALTGRGVHIVTVNDYLAARDATWIGKVFRFLNLSVGVVTTDTPYGNRIAEFEADIVYVTAQQLAFTFLQDNLSVSMEGVCLRRPFNYAIVDEVDSILIDECRNPYIINLPGNLDTAEYWKVAVAVAQELYTITDPALMANLLDAAAIDTAKAARLQQQLDFIPDYKNKQARLTQRGMSRAVVELANKGAVIFVQQQSSIQEEQQLVLVLVTLLPDGRQALTVRGAVETTTIFMDSDASIIDTLQSHGLTPVPVDSLDPQHIAAAVPAVLWDDGEKAWGRFIVTALKAVHMYIRDIDYIVKDDQIVIIDTATGRQRAQSRWQGGLHQALEAKEPEAIIRPEDFDQGRITFQVLFSYYNKLSGMTGTAATEVEEFGEAFNLRVVRVPPHKPSQRIDHDPVIYAGEQGWKDRIAECIVQAYQSKRPVLLGTSSVEESERVVSLIQGLSLHDVQLSRPDIDRLSLALDTLIQSGIPDVFNDPELAMRQGLYTQGLRFIGQITRGGFILAATVPFLLGFLEILYVLWDSRAFADQVETEQAVVLVITMLDKAIKQTRLDKNKVSVNLLNARPDRAQKEAETIAQAGLPGAITIATNIAGRGTDILLGGNPKGLTLIALKYYFLPYLVSDSVEALATLRPEDPPLKTQSPVFTSEADMKLHLPRHVMDAFLIVQQTLLASSSNSTKQDAEKAATELNTLLEAVEMERSHYLMYCRQQSCSSSIDTAHQWIDTQHSIKDSHWNALSETEYALQRYALLQWLWFDAECATYAKSVINAGGLLVLITSLQDTRRSELQLRGRSGRQGDPGESYVFSSPADAKLAATLRPDQFAGLWKIIEETDDGGNMELPNWTVMPTVNNVVRNYEQALQQGRDVTRRYDQVIDAYRRHVYRLRRTLVAGGSSARRALLSQNMAAFAVEMVNHYVADLHRHPRHWKLEPLMAALHALVNIPTYPSSGGIDMSTGLPDPKDLFPNEDQIPYKAAVKDNAVFAMMNLRVGNTTAALQHALEYNIALPIIDMPQQMPLLIKERATRASVRHQAAQLLEHPQAQRLAGWVGELLMTATEFKQYVAQRVYCNTQPDAHSIHAVAVVRTWEKHQLLGCLDSLWADFLQDIATLQQASQSRAFSQLDPLDEFKLESAEMFARLLGDFKRATVLAVLSEPVSLPNKSISALLKASDGSKDGVNEALDVDFAARWVKENNNNSSTVLAADDGNGTSTTQQQQQQPDKKGELSKEEDEMVNKLLGRLTMGILNTDVDTLNTAVSRIDEQNKSSDDDNNNLSI